MAGLGSALALFLVLFAIGLTDGTGGSALLIFSQFLALLVAGFVAGRFSGGAPALDGGMAGLLVYFISVSISVAGGSSLSIGSTLFLGVTAAILGSAGGVAAEFLRKQ